MKIIIISNLYPPISRGGAEKVVQRIVGELSSRGHEVTVISTMSFRDRPESKETPGETVYRFCPFNIYHLLQDYKYPYFFRLLWHLIDLFGFFSARRVGKIIETEKPDIILTHNLKGIGLRIPQMIKKIGVPFIHTIHDVQLSVPSGLLMYGEKLTFFERIFRRPYEIAVRWAISQPNLVISPSSFLANFYKKRGFFLDIPLQVLPNPVPNFKPSSRETTPSNVLRLLFAGQLSRHKGILDLLEAVNLLEIPFELHIAGDGPLASLVQEQCKKDHRLIFHGFVSTNCLQQLFNIVDATVVPSSCYENSPTIIYESLCSGVPVIASRIGGVGELIKNEINGYLVEPGNVSALAEVLRVFSTKTRIFNSRAETIRASVLKYSLKNYVDQLEGLIENLAKKEK